MMWSVELHWSIQVISHCWCATFTVPLVKQLNLSKSLFSPCTLCPAYLFWWLLPFEVFFFFLNVKTSKWKGTDSECLLPGGNNIFCFVSMREIWISFMSSVDKPLWSPSRGYPLLFDCMNVFIPSSSAVQNNPHSCAVISWIDVQFSLKFTNE